MRNCLPIFVLCCLGLTDQSPAANPAMAGVLGRTTYHPDKSRTESVQDPNVRELTETTYDANNLLTVRKHFLLNERGEPIQGNIYDGQGNLVARSISIYDSFQRRTEDRLMNLNGEVFQRVIHEYGPDGKAKKPKVIHLDAKRPTIRPAMMDFTQAQSTPAQPGAAPATPASDRFAPIVVPSATSPAGTGQLPPIYAPGTEPTGTPQPEPPKKSFFKRLFEKKK